MSKCDKMVPDSIDGVEGQLERTEDRGGGIYGRICISEWKAKDAIVLIEPRTNMDLSVTQKLGLKDRK